MHRDDVAVENSIEGAREIDRRTIAKGVAWTVPVVIVATAAPAAAASPPPAPSALLADVTGRKPNGSKDVTFIVSFTNIVGTSKIRITAVTGTGWVTTSPTTEQDLTAAKPSLAFAMTRKDASAVGAVDVTVSVNGVAQPPKTVTVTT